MSRSFNQYLWNIGKQIEDELLPKINTAFNCDFKRSDDVFDILDFVFTDKTMFLEVTPDFEYPVKLTGTNHIPHYLIPVKDLIEFDENNLLE